MTDPEAVRDALLVNPTLTINLLASQLNSTVDEVTTIIDEYEVLPDGSLRHNGPGQGGGWVPPAETEGSDTNIGWRWPDGSTREEAFDIGNPAHRAEMGFPDAQG